MSEWRSTTLGDEIELAYGKALPAHTRNAGAVAVYGSNGVVGMHDAALVDGPGIVVGRKGTVGATVYANGPYWPIDTTYYVVRKHGQDWRFLYYLLLASGLTTLNSHSTVPGLNREDVYRLAAVVPEVSEQERIAATLDLVREAADGQAAALDATKALKRAVMQELFTRGLRGGEPQESEIGLIPTGWEVTPMGSLGKIGNGSTPKRNNSTYWESGTFPWLTSAKVYDREITSADQFVTDTALRECHLPKVGPGAVLMAITGQGKTLGHVAVLEVPASVSQHVAYIQTDFDKAVPGFLRGYLETQYDYLRQVASGSGSTKGALTCAFLRDLPIPMPSTIEEQQEIVEILDALDAKIDLHRQKRALYEELFQALLHGLMTQEISVDGLDLSALPEREAVPA